jgi:hypothetical protein
MKLLRFRKLTDGRIRLLILLDTNQGETDQAWLYALTWSPKPDGVTVANYRDQIKQESKLLAVHELARRQAEDDEGTVVAGGGEGQAL